MLARPLVAVQLGCFSYAYGSVGVLLAEEPGLTLWGLTAEPGQSLLTQKKWWWLLIMGRLKPGVSQTQARAALEV
jgi:hypothetical protein